jgi:hypothetical protein
VAILKLLFLVLLFPTEARNRNNKQPSDMAVKAGTDAVVNSQMAENNTTDQVGFHFTSKHFHGIR